MSEYEVPKPKTPTKDTTRDQRIRVQTLFFDAGWSKPQIALQLNLTLNQVKYALRHRVTPQKQRTGRRPLLGPAERKQLIELGMRKQEKSTYAVGPDPSNIWLGLQGICNCCGI